MPGIGKSHAANVASGLRFSFRCIRFVLLVGICGAVPNGNDEEIILGDIIISDGVIEYDFGRKYPKEFIPKDTLMDRLGRPNLEIRAHLNKLKGRRCRDRLQERTSHYLSGFCQDLDPTITRYPGAAKDWLFKSTYYHKHHNNAGCKYCNEGKMCQVASNSTCWQLQCDRAQLISRQRLHTENDPNQHQPAIHFGIIASGDTVMKSAEDRDLIASLTSAIAFEMEGAGIWDNLPCIVIKGVCDYADSHKNKEWQRYAAATAAACTMAFIEELTVMDKAPLPSSLGCMSPSHPTPPISVVSMINKPLMTSSSIISHGDTISNTAGKKDPFYTQRRRLCKPSWVSFLA